MTRRERLGLAIFSYLARTGTLHVTLPGGQTATVGSGEPRAAVRINDYGALRDILRTGLTGFAESHMDGRVDIDDLPRLLRWGLANQASWFELPIARLTMPLRSIWQKIIPEKRHHRVRTMNDHYNLGNDFYRAWLDESMTYSAARFTGSDQSLADAQLYKYRTIADHAGLQPGMRVLEIGCGWGGFAHFAAAERGCEVLGITVAEEHAAFATKRIANAGLADKVEIAIRDFRDVTGEFDAIVSIEMIESVDETQWSPLFASMARSLRPGGIAAMQIITIGDAEWERYRKRADFIQQYIFPGGQLPAPKVLRSLAAASGLEIEQIETFGLDYARTLSMWRDRFEVSWPQLRRDNELDERFYRMWGLYLGLCEAGFQMGRINVEQWAFRKPAHSS
jgi:cyclopropane-fatty-acyl-phospholipid synthase